MQSTHLRPGSTIVVMDDQVVQDMIFTQPRRRVIPGSRHTGPCTYDAQEPFGVRCPPPTPKY